MAKENISVATTVLDVFTDDKVKELIELRPWMKTKKFVLLTKQQEIEAFFDECIKKGRCAYDLETTGLNTRIDPSTGLCYAKIVGICVSHDPDEGAYIPIAHEHADNYNVPLKFIIRETKRLAANCTLIFHNFKYDGAILKPHGVVFESEDQYEDTYLMAAIEDASRKEKGLKYLSGALLDRPQLEIDDLGIQGTAKNAVSFFLVPPQKAVYYGGGDAMNTMALYLYLKDRIDKQDPTGKEGPWAVYKVEKRCLFVTMEMENNLVKIDRKYLEETAIDVDLRMQKLIGDIYKIAGHQFDINSTKQLGVVLFEELGIEYPKKAEKTKKGDYQTNSEILEMVSSKNPIVSMILTYRGYVKIKGTYLDNWLNNADENDEVKFKLNQIQADTGRFSGSGGYGLEIDGYCGVNCQNVPTWDKSDPHSVNLRRAMIAHDGFQMVSIDYSGEELRIATNFSKEPKWVNEFLYGTGDLHTITGKIITGKSEITKKERSLGKCVAKGTLIASERGWIPIELIKKGDKVITHTGELKVVTDVWDMGVKPGIRIETRTGHRITCGLNHRYLTEADEWVRAEDLSKGTMIKTGSCANMDPQKIQRVHFNIWDKGNNSHVSEDLPYIEISPRWARLLGYILGDGSVNINHVSVVCSEIYTDVKDDIMKTAEGLGLSPKESKGRREREDGTYTKWLYKIHMGSRILVRFFREFGFSGRREWKDEKDSLTKHRSSKVFRVPPVIFSSPKYVIKEFLSALFETGGTVDAETSVTTKDRDLAEDLVLLLSMFGIRACIWDKFSKKYNKMYYKVSFGVAGSRIFEKEIGFISQDKKDRLYNLTHKQSKPHSGTYAVKWLSEVKETTLVGDVQLYDLTVDDDHTYIAQGLVTHNTVNFLTMYGGGAGGFAAQAKIPFEVAKKMILNFFKEYEGLNSWIKREWKASRNRGYSKTMLGRRRPLQEFYSSSDKGIQSKGDRCAINSAIQGCICKEERCLTDKFGYISINEIRDLKSKGENLKVWTGTSWEEFDVLDRGSCQLATIELSNGMLLKCDTRHEVLVVGGHGYEFRHFSKLDEDTEICVSIPKMMETGAYPPKYTSRKHSHAEAFEIDERGQWIMLSYLLGVLVGDGDIQYECGKVRFCFGEDKLKTIYPVISEFLKSLGIHVQEPYRNRNSKGVSYIISANSVTLIELIKEMGFDKNGAHNKRIPKRIFSSPPDMRIAFLKGYFDTDGCKNRRNRYGYHTPNVELLREVQLLGWTLGLASRVFPVKGGNYKLEWQNLKKLEEVFHLKSSLWKRMNVSNQMLLPEFLREPVKAVLQPVYDRKDKNDCAYFCKLNTGKKVTLPGILSFMDKHGVELPEEIYYHYKLKKKTVLDKVESTYTLSVHSDLHRFDSAGIISKNTGADIIKIALWRVYRWIKDNGLENDVKILLPVHDEVLFEVRKDKLDTIVPELCRLMKIRDVTDKLKWVVPLDVDAEYGDSFHVDHDFWKEMKAKMKETPVPAPEPLAEEFKPESPEKPEPVVVTETQVREDIHDIAPKEKSQENGHSTSSVLGVTTNNTPGYYQQMVINEGSVDNVTTRERVHNVLDSTEDNSDRTLFKDARINDNIDKEGFFNYKINVDLVSAQKIRFILELIRSSGNMFTGPKNRICLISKDGEVFLKTKDELSIDSFIALCIVFNV